MQEKIDSLENKLNKVMKEKQASSRNSMVKSKERKSACDSFLSPQITRVGRISQLIKGECYEERKTLNPFEECTSVRIDGGLQNAH